METVTCSYPREYGKCDGLSPSWLCYFYCTLLSALKVKVKSLSRVWLFATPWTVAHQASPSMEFSRHEYWSGLPIPSPGDLPDPGIEPRSPALQADTLPSELPGNLESTIWISSNKLYEDIFFLQAPTLILKLLALLWILTYENSESHF